VTRTRTFEVVTVLKVIERLILLLPATEFKFTQLLPFQYSTEKSVTPYMEKV
jgi:hypothetical protein